VIAFVRHGQTEMNRTGRLQGRVDAPLTDVGRSQAAGVARMLAHSPVVRVCTSPLGRAIATATPIAEAHGLTVEVDDRLVEVDYGDWDARGLGDLTAEEWARWRSDPAFAPPGGESLVQVEERIARFCLERLGEDLVVAVSHVSPIKAAVCWALGIDAGATWRMFLDLASVTRVGRRGHADGPPYLASFNETAPALTQQ
jgi:probable phosphoglycerate mutase